MPDSKRLRGRKPAGISIIIIPAGVNGFPVGGIVFLAPPEKILPVISQAQEIFTVSFHLGKPFMGDDRLVFQIGQQGIHIVLKRGKTGFPQIFFGNIKIAAGHEDQYQDCDACT